jgi:hypothetical protein
MAHGFFALAGCAASVAVVALVLLQRRLRKHIDLEVAEETLRRDFDDRIEDSLR